MVPGMNGSWFYNNTSVCVCVCVLTCYGIRVVVPGLLCYVEDVGHHCSSPAGQFTVKKERKKEMKREEKKEIHHDGVN